MNRRAENNTEGSTRGRRGRRRGRILLAVLSVLAVATGALGVLRSGGGTPVVWPRPYDPAKPLDIYNVPGVTPEQEAWAAELIEGTLLEASRFADIDDALAAGWYSTEDDMVGVEHVVNPDKFLDGHFSDPEHPEALMYRVVGYERVLAALVYMGGSGQAVDDPTLISYGGRLLDWHQHKEICSVMAPGSPVSRFAGHKDKDGKCIASGVDDTFGILIDGTYYDIGSFPMTHVWVVPNSCGPFANVFTRSELFGCVSRVGHPSASGEVKTSR